MSHSDHSRTSTISEGDLYSPPVSPVKETEPLLSRSSKCSSGSSTKSTSSSTTSFKKFGPRENKFPLFQTTQEELLKIAVERKRASSRIRQSMALRAALAEWENPAVAIEPEDDFAVVLEEEGEFVMSCLQ